MSEWERIREANRIRSEREAENKETAQRELADNATPETIRHRVACVVDELFYRDKLTPEQRRAALEINAVWVAITAGLCAKVQRYQADGGAGNHDWRAGTVTAYHERYIPWRNEAGQQAIKGRTMFDLVFALAVDNYGVRQLADSWRMDQRRVLDLARVSLHRYAEIGGWVDVCGRSQLCA